jgi:hypothetical protein
MGAHESRQLGPGVGDVMAELITVGATEIPIYDFRIGRFRSTYFALRGCEPPTRLFARGLSGLNRCLDSANH